MTRTLHANPQMLASLRQKEAEQEALERQREAETAERLATREAVRNQRDRAHAHGEEPIEAPTGKVEILARDGLLWLQRKGRLYGAKLSAALRYREAFTRAQITGFASSVQEFTGHNTPKDTTEAKVAAIVLLELARKNGLNRDENLIAIMDAVAGDGRTIRDLAAGNDAHASVLEAEFMVASRMLARFWGMGR